MGIRIDSQKINSLVMPMLESANKELTGICNQADETLSLMPSDFSFKSNFNEILDDLKNIKLEMKEFEEDLTNKAGKANIIEKNYNDKVRNLSSSINLVVSHSDSLLFNSKAKSNIVSLYNVKEAKNSNNKTGAKTTSGNVNNLGNADIQEKMKLAKIYSEIENFAIDRYNRLIDTSNDKDKGKKAFFGSVGKSTTLGIDEEEIEYYYKENDKKLGIIRYYDNNGRIVKCIDTQAGYVTISPSDNVEYRYYTDGTYTIYNGDSSLEKTEETQYFSKEGILTKKEEKLNNNIFGPKSRTTYYNSDGSISEIEEICLVLESRGTRSIVYKIYDGNGNLIKEKDKDGNIIKEYTYDVDGARKCYIDGVLDSTEYKDKIIKYGTDGKISQINYTNGVIENYSDGMLTSRIDENGLKTSYYYTESKEKIAVLENGDNSEKTYYDANGNITKKEFGKTTYYIDGILCIDEAKDIGMKVETYENNKLVDQYQIKDGIKFGKNFKEYRCFSGYTDRLKELNMQNKYVGYCQGIDTIRENYDLNGNITSVVLTGNVTRSEERIKLKEIYYPDGTYEYYENDKLVSYIKNENNCLTFYSSENSDSMRIYRKIDSNGNDMLYSTMGGKNVLYTLTRPDGSTVYYYPNGTTPHFETLADGTEIIYSENGSVSSITYPNGSSGYYDSAGEFHWR